MLVHRVMLEHVAILSLSASFIILLITRLGIVEKIQLRGSKMLSSLFSCNFCLSFWMVVLLYLFFYPFADISPLCIILATPITRVTL